MEFNICFDYYGTSLFKRLTKKVLSFDWIGSWKEKNSSLYTSMSMYRTSAKLVIISFVLSAVRLRIVQYERKSIVW